MYEKGVKNNLKIKEEKPGFIFFQFFVSQFKMAEE